MRAWSTLTQLLHLKRGVIKRDNNFAVELLVLRQHIAHETSSTVAISEASVADASKATTTDNAPVAAASGAKALAAASGAEALAAASGAEALAAASGAEAAAAAAGAAAFAGTTGASGDAGETSASGDEGTTGASGAEASLSSTAGEHAADDGLPAPPAVGSGVAGAGDGCPVGGLLSAARSSTCVNKGSTTLEGITLQVGQGISASGFPRTAACAPRQMLWNTCPQGRANTSSAPHSERQITQSTGADIEDDEEEEEGEQKLAMQRSSVICYE